MSTEIERHRPVISTICFTRDDQGPNRTIVVQAMFDICLTGGHQRKGYKRDMVRQLLASASQPLNVARPACL